VNLEEHKARQDLKNTKLIKAKLEERKASFKEHKACQGES